jgi:hypothetical protein
VGFAGILGLMTLQDVSAQIGPMPLPPNLNDYVKDEDWARILGKALFWDQKAGSDGMACAGCHFAAGADPRDRNQITPGFNQLPVVPDIDVEIRDDGVGSADPASGSGLRGLADRVSALGGELAIESPAGEGTAIRARMALVSRTLVRAQGSKPP